MPKQHPTCHLDGVVTCDHAFMRAMNLCRSYARGILAGLCELHSAGIAMLDVKPGNVLLADDGSPVLADFGISRELRDATRFQTSSGLGTPVYMAPEQFDPAAHVGRPADVWGWAATLVHMLSGREPFAGVSVYSIGSLVIGSRQHPEVPAGAGQVPGLEQLLLDCFQFEAARRPTAQQALCRLGGIMLQVGGGDVSSGLLYSACFRMGVHCSKALA
jgi:serine/threonine protein kinase